MTDQTLAWQTVIFDLAKKFDYLEKAHRATEERLQLHIQQLEAQIAAQLKQLESRVNDVAWQGAYR